MLQHKFLSHLFRLVSLVNYDSFFPVGAQIHVDIKLRAWCSFVFLLFFVQHLWSFIDFLCLLPWLLIFLLIALGFDFFSFLGFLYNTLYLRALHGDWLKRRCPSSRTSNAKSRFVPRICKPPFSQLALNFLLFSRKCQSFDLLRDPFMLLGIL